MTGIDRHRRGAWKADCDPQRAEDLRIRRLSSYRIMTFQENVSLARHRARATSMTSVRLFVLPSLRLSVCLSVTLVDCDHTVQQKVKMDTWPDISVSWLPTFPKANPDRNILRSRILPRKTSDPRYMKTVDFCISAAILSLFNGSHVAQSQHLQSFLL